jgi:predicted nuclease of predicted toxin-antitoxin system
MKFLVNAHLPRRIVRRLQELGHDAMHTMDLPLGNRTPDETINEVSIRDNYIVITKDSDFVDSFTLYRKPYKLLLISTGNIKNADLEALLLKNIDDIVSGFEAHDYIEMSRTALIIHV